MSVAIRLSTFTMYIALSFINGDIETSWEDVWDCDGCDSDWEQLLGTHSGIL